MYGLRETISASLNLLDGSLITDHKITVARWVEHFQAVLNQRSDFDSQVLSEIPQWTTAAHLDEIPTVEEIQCALKQM